MHSMSRLETNLHKTEAGLWILSTLPAVNLVAGPCKAAIGVVQVITGFVYTVFATLACVFTGDRLATEGLKHIAHGSANILSGIAYSIPLIGNIIAIYKWIADDGIDPWRYEEVKIPRILVVWN